MNEAAREYKTHDAEPFGGGPRPTAADGCAECALRAHTFYSTTVQKNPQVIESLRREVATFPPRRIVLRQGESSSKMFTVKSGWAFRFTLLPDGRRMILSFLLPSDFVGASSTYLGVMPYSVQSLTDLTLCGFDTGELTGELYKSRASAERLAGRFIRLAAEADQRVLGLGRRTAGERVASFILRVTNKLNLRGLAQGDSFPFPLRQEHMADALGLTAVHVSRTISILRGKGIISLDRHTITIHDRDRLIEFAGRNEATALP